MVRFQSIEESLGKIKELGVKLDKRLIYNAAILVCAAISSLMVCFVASFRATANPVVLETCSMVFQATGTPATSGLPGGVFSRGPYVGSVSSDKFHHESCPGARLIKEGNKVYFSNKEDALKAGYAPAGNCDM